jgi:hypothetical protein
VALLGDSQAEGNMVDRHYLSTTVAADLLNRYMAKTGINSYSTAEVINAGVYGYEPCQFLRLFEARVKQFRPDIVYVLHFSKFADDVFCVQKGGALTYENLSYSKLQYNVRYFLSYVRTKSQLLNYLYRVYRHHFAGGIHLPEKLHKEMFTYEPPALPASSTLTNDSRLLVEYTQDVVITEGEPPAEQSRELMKAVYGRLADLISGYGGQLRVLIAHADAKNRILAHDLMAAGIPFFDLASYLSDIRQGEITFPLAAHWNEHGHQLVGHVLFRLVTELETQ